MEIAISSRAKNNTERNAVNVYSGGHLRGIFVAERWESVAINKLEKTVVVYTRDGGVHGFKNASAKLVNAG